MITIGNITIRCPTCGLETIAPRQDYDHPKAVLMETWCETCVDGGFDDVHYYDAQGNELPTISE